MLDKSQLPRFDSPPVVETALSVQFAPLSGFTNAHAGWFWKNYLPSEWYRVVPAVRINDVFENFGENRKWKLPDELSISNAPTPHRLQIIRNDNNQDRRLQL